MLFCIRKDVESRFFDIRPMGAIDRLYRFICCMPLGDAAKNEKNASIDANCKPTGLQEHVSGPCNMFQARCSYRFLNRVGLESV